MISKTTHVLSPIAAEVADGLTRTPKSLSPKLFYDQTGSELFEEITRLPEYYLTRTEQQLLREFASDIVRHVAGPEAPLLTLVELGAGTATKTSTIIDAILKAQPSLAFYPIDVSPAALETAASHLTRSFPRLIVRPMVTDYTDGIPTIDASSRNTRRLVLYIGSSVGNFEPMDASAVLVRVRHTLFPGDALLLGTDLAKSPNVLLPAYNDASGITARFNKNLLARINRELGAHFDLDSFRHIDLWNAQESRIEMHLESICDQTVSIDDLGLRVSFRKNERIHTENSYKFTHTMASALLQNAGFVLEHTWTDSREWFALHLARVP